MNYIITFILICAVITTIVILLRFLQVISLFIKKRRPPEIEIVPDEKLPKVTVMIPAFNEEKVIAKTLETILNLDYPDDKFQILIINPGSTDRTGEIVREIAVKSKRNVMVKDAVDDFVHHGKPRALNFGLKHASGEVIVIYDADSLVDKMAVKYLASYLVTHPQVGIAFGMRKAINPHSFFARLVYLESLSQQLMTEAAPPKEGKKILFCPGTNVAIRRSLLDELGGWDDNALTEDFEISLRVHSRGYRIEYVHSALSHEEVVEKLKIWMVQRTRWVRGGNQAFLKNLLEMRKNLIERKLKFINLLIFLNILEFYSPPVALASADLVFFLGLIEIFFLGGLGIGFFLWLIFYALLILLVLACVIYVGELNFKNVLGALLFYFYFQLWLIVFFRVVLLDLFHTPNLWEKTERFAS